MSLPTLIVQKLKASAVHFLISLTVAGMAAALVFFFWYPYPYRELVWGQGIYTLIIGLDVALGPLMTLIIYHPRKKLPELMLDFGVVGALQLGALIFGVWALAQARPVHVVFQYDHFEVVPVYLVREYNLATPTALTLKQPWLGPTLLSLKRQPSDEADIKVWESRIKYGGPPLAAYPQLWRRYEDAFDEINAVGQSIERLRADHPGLEGAIDKAVAMTGIGPGSLISVPVRADGKSGVLLLRRDDHKVVGFVHTDLEPMK